MELLLKKSLILTSAIADESDILSQLLADKRSANTRRAYQGDLTDFFKVAFARDATQEVMTAFLELPRLEAISHVLKYKSRLLLSGMKEATLNRRLAAIKSLVNYARKIGKCEFTLEDIAGEKVTPYRDTSGLSVTEIKQMLSIPKLDNLKGVRDYAILKLLWENALRRNEVASCNVCDFDADNYTLSILGKGRGSQKELITLSPAVVTAIKNWLDLSGGAVDDPLFTSVSHNKSGSRLTGSAIYELVSETAKAAGITKKMSPHRIRHSAITAALDATNGNIREVQKLSRHKVMQTLMLYDDNRENAQGKITNLLSDLV